MNNFSNIPPSKKSLMNNITNLMILACLDGKVSEEEQNLINDIAHSYGLTEEEYNECGQKCNECLKENKFLIEVPESNDAKVGFMKNLVVTMMIDGRIDENERQLVEAIAERFGFKPKELVDFLIQSITEEFHNHGMAVNSDAQPKEETTKQDDEAFRKEVAEQVKIGKEALMKNDIVTAFNSLMGAALVDKEGCFLFLELFSVGKRIHQLTEQQATMMQALADKGYAVAQYGLGRYHQVKRPERESLDKALSMFNAAAKAGLPDAAAARALMIIRGQLGEIDRDRYFQEIRDAYDNGSHLASYYLYKAVVYGEDGIDANPQAVIDNIKNWLAGKESEDLSEINPVYYEILAMAYSALNQMDQAAEYYMKCVRMGRADLYSDYVIATCYNEEFEPLDESKLLKALETGISLGDSYCYVLRADLYERQYAECDDEKKEELSAQIAQNLKVAGGMGEGIAYYKYGYNSYFGDYGFEEDNKTAWNCFFVASEMNIAQAWTMICEMIVENDMPGERPSSDFLNYARLMSVRLGEDDLLPVLIYNYYKGTMRKYENEIKKYYLPRYEALPDEVKTKYFGTQFIAIVNTEGTANLVEFDLATEEWDELSNFIDADRLDAIRTEPLTHLGEEMGLDERITAWVDRNGIAKGLEPNPIGGKLYPGPIVGDMILTLEDSEYHPMSFGDLAELKEIVTSLGAEVGDVYYNEFPDEDYKYDPHA